MQNSIFTNRRNKTMPYTGRVTHRQSAYSSCHIDRYITSGVYAKEVTVRSPICFCNVRISTRCSYSGLQTTCAANMKNKTLSASELYRLTTAAFRRI
jgi:hypothetical protein